MKPMRSVAPSAKYPIKFPRFGSMKLDGIRMVKVEGKALTKSLKQVPNPHIREWIERNLFDGADGEIISGPPNIESVYNTTFSAVMTQSGEPEFKVYLFDLWDRPDLTAAQRYVLLSQIVAALPPDVLPFVEVVPKVILTSLEDMEVLYAQALAEGYEGLVTQDMESLYKFGKATEVRQEQLKHKPEKDAEAEVLEIYEAMRNDNEAFVNEVGETQRSSHAENKVGKNMLGGFLVRDLETKAVFKVAPGKMKEDERITTWQLYLQDPEAFKGRLIRYRSMDYGTMTNGAMRHGRFYGWRDRSDMSLP